MDGWRVDDDKPAGGEGCVCVVANASRTTVSIMMR